GLLGFRNDSDRTRPAVAWSDIRLVEGDAGPVESPSITARGISLLNSFPSAQIDFDRRENYPDYTKFDSPTGKPAFVWWDNPGRPARLSLVTIAGARLSYDVPAIPEGAYLEFGVSHGTGIGDGV